MKKMELSDYYERVSVSSVQDFCLEHKLVLKSTEFVIENLPMGSGGVGHIRHMVKSATIRQQLSYGVGRNNYANVAVFEVF